MNSLLILRALKEKLKKNGVTYKELARKLGLTEAAIKKQFQSSDISFNRINDICEVMEIPVGSLLSEVGSRPIVELKLDQVQESVFVKEPKLFIFFLKLSKENGDIEKANADFKMDSALLWKTLKKLEDIKLLKLLPNKKIKLKHGSLVTIPTSSPVMQAMTRKLAQDYIDRHQYAEKNSKHLKINLLKLSQKNAEQLKTELIRLSDYYQRQSELDGYSQDTKEVSTYSLLLALGEFSFI